MAPRIFISLIVLGAECQSNLKSIETPARAFFKVIIFSIGSVKTLIEKLGTYIAILSHVFKSNFDRCALHLDFNLTGALLYDLHS